MKELSLHILDIAQNSIAAGARHIDISVIEDAAYRTLTVRDDGRGMSEELLERVQSPFTTTRTTRNVGMGIPLLKLAAEQAGGALTIASAQGERHGTTVEATFELAHIDCVPLGDLASTMTALIQGSPGIEFTLDYRTALGQKWLSTAQMRETLQDVLLNTPEVLQWVSEYVREPFE